RLEIELVDRDVERPLLFIPQDLDRHRRAGLGGHDHLDQLIAVRYRAPLELNDHVAWLEARFRGRAAWRDRGHDGAGARSEAEILVPFPRHRTDRNTDPSADDLALTQLRQQIAHRVDRHRETDADVTLRPSVA